jgi:hypothetical protein
MIPARVKNSTGRHALVDGIPFAMPVSSSQTPALIAAFTIDADRAATLLPGNELYPLRLPGGRGLLILTIVDYRVTNIGRYIEYSIGIACLHRTRSLPWALLRGRYGQYVFDLPVSSEISVKGGKGIWGMPKHQQYLEFEIADRHVASRYYLDGELAVEIEIEKPRFAKIPLTAGLSNFCAFRGMLMKSTVYFRCRAGFNLPFTRSARLTISDHPRVAPLKTLDIADKPLISMFLSDSNGTLDDHTEAWFLSFDQPPAKAPQGFESVIDLGLSEEWLASPTSAAPKPSP